MSEFRSSGLLNVSDTGERPLESIVRGRRSEVGGHGDLLFRVQSPSDSRSPTKMLVESLSGDHLRAFSDQRDAFYDAAKL